MDWDLIETTEPQVYSQELWDDMTGDLWYVECGLSFVPAGPVLNCGLGAIGASE